MRHSLPLAAVLVSAAVACADPPEVWVDDDFSAATPGWGTTHFAAVQAGIDAVAAGGIVNVAAGVYPEANVTIPKSLTLRGSAGAILDGQSTPGATGLQVRASDVTVERLEIRNYWNGITGWQSTRPEYRNVRIRDNTIHHMDGTGAAGFGIYMGWDGERWDPCNGTWYDPNLTDWLDYTGLEITGNEIHHTTQAAIVLQMVKATAGTLLVARNHVYDSPNSAVWIDGARDVTVTDNDLHHCANGVFVSAYADSCVYTSWGVPDTRWGPRNLDIRGNFIRNHGQGVGFRHGWPALMHFAGNAYTANGAAVSNGLPVAVDCSANWWESADPAAVAAAAGNRVDFTPWLASGTDTDPNAPGFQGDLSARWVDDASPQTGGLRRIQEGIDLAPGGTVHLAPGLYEEQVVLTASGLELLGSGRGPNPAVDTIIRSPVGPLPYSFLVGAGVNYPIIGVHDAANVSVSNLRVDGFGRGNGNFRFLGIAYWNADGTVAEVDVTGVRDTPLSNASHGLGIYAYNNTGGPYAIAVTGAAVDDYQKIGIALLGPGLMATVAGCTVTGVGPTTVTAQSGIQIGTGASGSVTGCTITGHLFAGGGNWAASGVLPVFGGTVDVTGCTLIDNVPGAYYVATEGVFAGNTVRNNTEGAHNGLIAYKPLDTGPLRGGGELPLPAGIDMFPHPPESETMTVSVAGGTFTGRDAPGSVGIFGYCDAGRLIIDAQGAGITDWEHGLVLLEAGTGTITSTVALCRIYSNIGFGFLTNSDVVQSAVDNYWGDPSGPYDASGTMEAPPCADPAVMINADGVGNPASFNVNYCPWHATDSTVLALVPQQGACYEPNDVLTAEVHLTGSTEIVVGGQFHLSFDPAKLTYLGGDPGDPPFTRELIDMEPESGRVFYAVGHPDGGTGTHSDTVMARLRFRINPGVSECGTAGLVSFASPNGPYSTKLSNNVGEPVAASQHALSAITVDAQPPSAGPVTVDGGNLPPTGCAMDVTFSATVADNCCLETAGVQVVVALLDPNVATLGVPVVVKTQIDPQTVGVSGSVRVSDLRSCPATVRVYVEAVDCCGTVMATASGSGDVNDATPPVISNCPADFAVNAEAGTTSAHVWWTEPTAADNCTLASFVADHQPGELFPPGPTLVTYTARDQCGNTSTCSFTVTVRPFNDVVLTVQLSPNISTGGSFPQTLTRCITFEVWNCDPPNVEPDAIVSQEVTFTVTAGTPNVALGAATLTEVPAGAYACITARDKLHTLRRTATLTINASHQYAADFTGDPAGGGDWLIGGNLNDDSTCDILDFGVYSWQFTQVYGSGNTTCATAYPHADLNGDGIASVADFTFIQVHFGKTHEANCCGAGSLGEPVRRISVDELIRLGLAELAAGDWNHDGWLDEADMAAFVEQHLARAGDLNCDGVVNFNDINPFVLILSDPVGWQAQYPGCPPANGDVNRDGQVNFDDINPFVALLSR
ncbi:MAG: HYR domain-containing protein [Planctomycetota bacterium]